MNSYYQKQTISKLYPLLINGTQKKQVPQKLID